MRPFREHQLPSSQPHSSFSLADLAANEDAIVSNIAVECNMRQRLLDLGLTEGTIVRCLGHSPAGDPAAYRIRGAVIALRKETAASIFIERT